MNNLMKKQKEIEKTVVDGYYAIEAGVVSGYHKIEDGVVSTYKQIEKKFVDTFLTSNEQSAEEDAQCWERRQDE